MHSSDLAVALRDIKSGESQSVHLRVSLDEWEVPDADHFEYAVSYFDSVQERWFITPSNVVRLRRATPDAFEEIQKINRTVADAFAIAVADLQAKQVEEAAEALRQALEQLDASQYQDDSYINSAMVLLSDVYGDCLKLLRDDSHDVGPLLTRMDARGTELGLNGYSTPEKNDGGGGLSDLVKGILIVCSVCLAAGLVYIASRFGRMPDHKR